MRSYHYYIPIFLQKIGYAVFFCAYKIFVGLEIRGRENLTHLSGPVIFASNHTSELDPTAIPLVLPFFSSLHPMYYVSNPTEKYKTFGWRKYIYGGIFFNLLGAYAIFSGHKNYGISLDNHIRLLRKGKTVCIFPEGKRTRDGHMNPARGGLGYLVHTTGATVVPVAINTFYNMSLLDFFTRQRKVVLTVLSPMTREDLIDIAHPTVDEFRQSGQKVLDKIAEVLER